MTDLISRIRESDFFDDEYYLQNYKEEISSTTDYLHHFLTVGLQRGFKPNSRFDPLVYRLQHPDIDRDQVITHYFSDNKTRHSTFSIADALHPVERTYTFLPIKDDDIDFDETAQAAIAYARLISSPRAIDFCVDSQSYQIVVPSAQALLDRLRTDRPFAFARVSHGDWDDHYVFERYRGRVARAVSGLAFTEEHIDRLAMRLCDEFYPDGHIFAENFIPEFTRDLTNRSRRDDFMMSVAFKGYPTADEQLFIRTLSLKRVDIARLRIFARFFRPDETVYDANLMKRWAVSGALSALPGLARQRPVIFMGAERLASLGQRWDLPWFLQVRIPPANSYPLRHKILATALEMVRQAKNLARQQNTAKPLFILQGSSFAFWMMHRLFHEHPDIFYIDLGQTLHIWFYDNKDIPLMTWGKIYKNTIIDNCDLNDYYKLYT